MSSDIEIVKCSGLFVGDSRDRSMQSEEMLQAFVDVAVQIEGKQFIEELPSLSARSTRCERCIRQLLVDTTGGSCHGDEKCDLHEINKRYLKVLPVCLGCVLANNVYTA